jgi:hypothetical protein
MAINMIEIVDSLYCLGLRKPHISEAGSASVFRYNREIISNSTKFLGLKIDSMMTWK